MNLDFTLDKQTALSNVRSLINRLSRLERHRGDNDPIHQKGLSRLDDLYAREQAIMAISDEEWLSRHENAIAKRSYAEARIEAEIDDLWEAEA